MKDAFDLDDWQEAKRPLLEKDIENPSVRTARAAGWYVRKYKSPAQRSAPDRIFGKTERVFFVEFKRPGKKPTKKQGDEHKKMREAGLTVYVCDDLYQFKMILAREEELADACKTMLS